MCTLVEAAPTIAYHGQMSMCENRIMGGVLEFPGGFSLKPPQTRGEKKTPAHPKEDWDT